MITDITPTMVFIALLGGVLPAIFWLSFWLKEDDLHPEPRGLIILSFLMGMLATVCAYPIEKFLGESIPWNENTLLVIWAAVEELLKFGAIFFVALRSRYFDEPIDAVLYLVTVALGFAALENALFLINPLGAGDTIATIMLGNFRFIGATVLHVAASGLLGLMIAMSFYDTRLEKQLSVLVGILASVALHAAFNIIIIMSEGAYLYHLFIGLWIIILWILFMCEKLKLMPPRSHVEYPDTGAVVTLQPRKF
jgi:RsiW-degrading membrane proteinase PrsW (M82 family)